MKTQILILSTMVILGTASLSFTPSPSKSQQLEFCEGPSSSFSFFRTHRQGKAGVTATWGLASNVGVREFIVRKTYEDPYDEYAVWQVVSVQACSQARSYKCMDENVQPGMISYQVVAVMEDGNTFSSQPITQRIVSH